ncbi:MAG TPA: hypothetical protein VGW40_01860 [Allosphingosinicella sp.]|nr:hypothetical protein [Allosphingosinicella sp.]
MRRPMLACACVLAGFLGAGSNAAASIPSEDVAAGLVAPVAAAVAAQGASTLAIEWRVDRRFRLWNELETAQPVEGLLDRIGATDDPAVVHDAIVTLLTEHGSLHRSAFWDESARAYPPRYFYPSEYKARLWLRGAAEMAGRQCVWTATAGRIGGAGRPVDCAAEVELVLPSAADHSGSVPATVRVAVAGLDAPATAQVAVRDRLIVSLGDSFASGEGNPDRPADLGRLRSGPGAGADRDRSQNWLARSPRNLIGPASWFDTTCHRSFYNQHLVAALGYAARHPREAVTFASYACTGAAIFGGLLTEQPKPPGYYDDAGLRPQEVPQLDAMVRDLCPALPGGGAGSRRLRRVYQGTGADGARKPVSTENGYACLAPGSRRIDAVLLAIGGNDADFARLVAELLLPPANPLNLPYALARKRLTLPLGQSARYIENALAANLSLVRTRLGEIDPRARVFQSAYPSPVRDRQGGLCGPADQRAADAARHPSVPRLRVIDGIWFFGLDPGARPIVDQQEGRAIEATVIGPLNRTIAGIASPGWRFVDSYLSALDGHGWCAGDGVAETADLPVWDAAGRRWLGWNPADWRPYARRGRYFRTPTDSALTLAPVRPRSELLGLKLDIPRVGLVVSLAGSIHPTFEAHAIMGHALAAELDGLAAER